MYPSISPPLGGGAVFSFAHKKVLSPIPYIFWYNHPIIDPFTGQHIHLSVSLIERAQRNIICVCDECSIERELQTQSVFLLSVFLSSPCCAFLSTHYCCTSFFSDWYNRPISTFFTTNIVHSCSSKMSRFWYFFIPPKRQFFDLSLFKNA